MTKTSVKIHLETEDGVAIPWSEITDALQAIKGVLRVAGGETSMPSGTLTHMLDESGTPPTCEEKQRDLLIEFYANRIDRILSLHDADVPHACNIMIDRCTTKIRELLNGKQLENLTEPDEETEVTP